MTLRSMLKAMRRPVGRMAPKSGSTLKLPVEWWLSRETDEAHVRAAVATLALFGPPDGAPETGGLLDGALAGRVGAARALGERWLSSGPDGRWPEDPVMLAIGRSWVWAAAATGDADAAAALSRHLAAEGHAAIAAEWRDAAAEFKSSDAMLASFKPRDLGEELRAVFARCTAPVRAQGSTLLAAPWCDVERGSLASLMNWLHANAPRTGRSDDDGVLAEAAAAGDPRAAHELGVRWSERTAVEAHLDLSRAWLWCAAAMGDRAAALAVSSQLVGRGSFGEAQDWMRRSGRVGMSEA